MPRAFVMLVVVATILTIGVFPAAGQPQPRAGDHPDAPQVIQQATATADFNGDGRFDLAVGAPGEDVGATVDAGAVNIFYGLANGGLPSTASQTLVQDNPEAGDHFGAALTAGSFNNDSITDLVVGVPGEDVGTRADAGAVNVFYGATGSLPSSSQLLLQDNPEGGDQFGAALAEGLLTNVPGTPNTADGFSDLVVGAPGENVGAIVDAGAANAFYDTSGVLPGVSSQTLVQDNPEAGDRFGAALTAAPFTNDIFTDLVVGAPGENVGGIVDAGAANAFYDTSGVLPGVSSRTLLQDNPEAGDRFGAALTAGAFASDFFFDLVVGAPGENVGATVDAGAANAFYDTSGVLPGVSSQTLLQDNVEAGDRFGAALTTGFFSTSGFFDLIVGAPGENVGATVDAGAANVFHDTSGVLPGVSSQTLLQDNPEAGDGFGAALTAKFISSPDSFLDLVVGAPTENVGARVDAGAANVFNNTTGVLPGTSSQTLLQSNIEAGDRFGAAFDN
jgi:hypothetical protein